MAVGSNMLRGGRAGPVRPDPVEGGSGRTCPRCWWGVPGWPPGEHAEEFW